MAPLSYTDWPQWPDGRVREWTIKEPPSALDVGQGDVLTLSLVASGLMIKIASITCAAHTPAHDANSWVDKACGVMDSNWVKGSRPSPLFDQFELVSSEVDEGGGRKHNKLTCSVVVDIPKPRGLKTAGAVCWTAEDG